VCPDYPPELEKIVMKSLAVEPAERHASAMQMMLELEAFAREHKLAASSVAVARLMDELFPPHERAGAVIGLEAVTDLEYAEIVEIRPPRPWYRGWLAALALTTGVAIATWPLASARRAPAEELAREARASAGRIADRLASHMRAAQARAAAMAATPMLRAAASTDARTVEDMVAHEALLAPQPGEVIELLQWRGDRAVSLLRLPAGSNPTAPVAARATRIDPAGDGLVVTASARMVPAYGGASVDAALVVAAPLTRSALAVELPRGAAGASLRGLEREIPLTAGATGRAITVPVVAPGLPPLALAVALPAVAGDHQMLARSIAIALAIASLAFFLIGRHRYRWWRRRS